MLLSNLSVRGDAVRDDGAGVVRGADVPQRPLHLHPRPPPRRRRHGAAPPEHSHGGEQRD